MGATFGTVFGGVIAGGLAIAGAKIGSFVTGAVDAFAAVEDALGAAGVLFGAQLPAVTRFAESAGEAFGLSKQTALEAQNTFGGLGKAAGLAGPDLAGFAGDLTGLAGDLASFKGTSTEQAVQAIGAALRGETEPIRAYNVLLDDATLRQEALALGLIATTKDALTPQQKTLAAQSAILKQTADAQGDYQRTSDSTANTQKRLALETENAKVALGEKLAPAVTALRGVFLGLVLGLGGAFDVFNSIGVVVGTVLAPAFSVLAPVATALFAAFQFALPVLLPLAAGVAAFALALSAGSSAAGIASAATAAYAAITTGVAFVVNTARAAVLLFNLALAANPIGIVIALLVALVAGLVVAYKSSETFRDIVNGAWESIKGVVFPIVEAFGKVISTVFDFVKAYLTTVFGFYKALFTGDFGAMRDIVVGVFDKIKDVVSTVFGAVKDFLSSALDGINRAFADAWSAVKDATSAAFEAVSSAVSSGVDAAVDFVVALPGRFISGLGDLAGTLGRFASTAWAAFTTGVSTAFNATAEFVRGIPEKIVSALGNVGSILLGAGRSIIDGLLEGISAGFRRVRDKLGELTSLLPDWKGPAKVDARILYGSGQLVVGGFIKGLEATYPDVERSLGGATRRLAMSATTGVSAGIGSGGLVTGDSAVAVLERVERRLANMPRDYRLGQRQGHNGEGV